MIEPEWIDRLRRLTLVTRRRFPGSGPGEKGVAEPGGRTEFSGYRHYEPGEDFRDIDWNLYARHEQLYIREFRKEEGVTVRVFLDSSASMGEGDPPKHIQARRVAAGLGMIALTRHHRVDLWSATGAGLEGPRRFAGPERIGEYLKVLEGILPQGQVDLGSAVARGAARATGGALSFWISDGYGKVDARRSVARLPMKPDDAVFLLVSAPGEVEPVLDGNQRLVDSETGQAIDISLGPREREIYRHEFREFVNRWRKECLAHGVRFAWVRSDQSLGEIFFKDLARGGIVSL